MLKKENFIPVILIVVGIAFVTISILLFFSKGNAKLLKHKLKLGAIIIGLTATAASCVPTTCYDVALPPEKDRFIFNVDSSNYNTIFLKLPKDSLLKGKIFDRTQLQYSYLIQDYLLVEKYRDNIIPEYGNFDSTVENFIMKIPVTMDAGLYYMYIYTVDKSQIDSASPIHSKQIEIIK